MPPQNYDASWRHQKKQERVEAETRLIGSREWILDVRGDGDTQSSTLYALCEQGRAERDIANIGGQCAHLRIEKPYNEVRVTMRNERPETGDKGKLLNKNETRRIANFLQRFGPKEHGRSAFGSLTVVMRVPEFERAEALQKLGFTEDLAREMSGRVRYREIKDGQQVTASDPFRGDIGRNRVQELETPDAALLGVGVPQTPTPASKVEMPGLVQPELDMDIPSSRRPVSPMEDWRSRGKKGHQPTTPWRN